MWSWPLRERYRGQRAEAGVRRTEEEEEPVKETEGSRWGRGEPGSVSLERREWLSPVLPGAQRSSRISADEPLSVTRPPVTPD